MTDLSDLIARIEAASGPSYALECEIWDAIYPGERAERFAKLTAAGKPYHGRLGPADVDGYVQPLRAFTASIDAALTLVPDGYFPTIDFVACRCWIRDVQGFDMPHGCAYGCGDTPALALCAAALRGMSNL